MANANHWSDQFDLAGNLAFVWWTAAERLLTSSGFLCLHDALHQLNAEQREALFRANQGLLPPAELRVGGVILMLRGMAIECLLKGLWVDKGYKLAAGGKYLKIPGTMEHNLLSLCTAVDAVVSLGLTTEDHYVLERLSAYIVLGRYPIPKVWETTRPKTLPTGDFGPITYWRYPTDEDTFRNLTEKLISKLSFYPSILNYRWIDGQQAA